MRTVFEIWAPYGYEWTEWAKGTVFAGLSAAPQVPEGAGAPMTVDVAWAPAAAERVAMVLDLSGMEGVALALGLAEKGYRPVPLYNALPGLGMVPGVLSQVAVDMSDLVRALSVEAERLAAMHIATDAPPVFMLEAARRGERAVGHGDFDNRSVSFPTDFPSGTMLRSKGIQQVVVVQRGRRTIQDDLAHTLRGWQASGVELRGFDLTEGAMNPLVVKNISWLRLIFERMAMRLGFRRSRLGGYGDVIPMPGAG